MNEIVMHNHCKSSLEYIRSINLNVVGVKTT